MLSSGIPGPVRIHPAKTPGPADTRHVRKEKTP